METITYEGGAAVLRWQHATALALPVVYYLDVSKILGL
jgi:hypothetical protein